jgi:hypothetical protein
MDRLLAISFFIAGFIALAQETSIPEGTAVVRGSLFDPQRAVVGGTYEAAVTLACDRQPANKQRIPLGQYQYQVAPGLCSLAGEAKDFHTARRAPFRLRAGDDVTIDLFARIHLSGIATEVSEKGLVDHYTYLPRPKYKEFQAVAGLPALLEYQRKNWFSGWYRYCLLTWDHYTIRAERMKYDATRRAFRAEGNVRINDGHVEHEAQRLLIRLPDDNNPILTTE